ADVLLTDHDPELLLKLVGKQRRKQPHGVLGLLETRSRRLYPRLGVIGTDRVSVRVERLDTARPESLDSTEPGSERVVTPALEPFKGSVSIDEPARLRIGGVAPEPEPSLLVRPDPRVCLALLKVDPGRAEGLPTERMSRERPASIVV